MEREKIFIDMEKSHFEKMSKERQRYYLIDRFTQLEIQLDFSKNSTVELIDELKAVEKNLNLF